jgi:hypothetical protein
MSLDTAIQIINCPAGADSEHAVPEQEPVVYQAIHGVAHPDIRATRRLKAVHFILHRLSKDVNNWCLHCQASQ